MVILKFCPNCGNSIQENQKFCQDCGYMLTDYAAPAAQPAGLTVEPAPFADAGAAKPDASADPDGELFPEDGMPVSENTFDNTPFAGAVPKAESVGFSPEAERFSDMSVPEGAYRVNGFAIAALVLGIAAFFLNFLLFIPGILAIIFAVVGMNLAKVWNNGRGMAIAGLVLGIVSTAIYVFVVLFAFSLSSIF